MNICSIYSEIKMRLPWEPPAPCEGCGIKPGGCSQGLQEAPVDFGAHESFEKAAQRLARHYPVNLSDSTVRKITLNAGQKARAAQEHEGGAGALPAHGVEWVEAQADGTMPPMPGFKNGMKDKRKARQCHRQEQRLCMTRAQGTCKRTMPAAWKESRRPGTHGRGWQSKADGAWARTSTWSGTGHVGWGNDTRPGTKAS
jgi:hypothetical protein